MKKPRFTFKVPLFSPGCSQPEERFYWWSWHPNYPYWSKSCWGGKTKNEAMALLDDPRTSSLKFYHNKLIKEGDGKFVEVFDMPCREIAVWKRIQCQRRKALKRHG